MNRLPNRIRLWAAVLLATAGAVLIQPAASTASSVDPTAATDLRVALNTLLQEHVYLAGAATGAALAGRSGEFEAAAAALDENSKALAGAVGSVYGEAAGEAFLALWRKHIGFFVDYTQGTAAMDEARKKKAVEDLMGYAEDFGAFLQAANPNLPKATVAELVRAHVLTLAKAVDAQAEGDAAKAYAALRDAAGHMQMIADPLADAIARQFPDRFASR